MSTTLPYFAFYLSRAIGISPPMTIYVALERLFRQSSPSAHEIVLGFRNFLSSPHMAASSNNRHLATLRSVTKLGRMLGMMSSYLEVAGVKGEKRRKDDGDRRSPMCAGYSKQRSCASCASWQQIGRHVWCHGLRHSSITAALDVAAKAGIELDKVRAHSRHAAIGTLLICADEHDREGTQRTLADLVARTLTTSKTS